MTLIEKLQTLIKECQDLQKTSLLPPWSPNRTVLNEKMDSSDCHTHDDDNGDREPYDYYDGEDEETAPH